MPSRAESSSPSWRAAALEWARLRSEAGFMRRAGHELRAETLMAEVARALREVADAHRAEFRARRRLP